MVKMVKLMVKMVNGKMINASPRIVARLDLDVPQIPYREKFQSPRIVVRLDLGFGKKNNPRSRKIILFLMKREN